MSTQLKNECIGLVEGSNNKTILMESIKNTFWKAKNPDAIIGPIDEQSLLETSHKYDILYCKEALKRYEISKELHDTILKDLNTEAYFFENYIEILEDVSDK